MEEHLIAIVAILALGIGAQWLAWRLGLPAILLLLAAGFIAGPVSGFLDPDALLGDLLLPAVSLGVALILFEGGLSLRLSELGEGAGVVWRLVTVGAIVTWLLASAAAFYLTDLGIELALLVGSVLVVTGPTVIIPLLRLLRLRVATASILKWEAILIDPIGAILAVLVFEGILAGTVAEATTVTILGLGKSLLVGAGVGLATAAALTFALKKYYIPDYLQSPLSLVAVGSVLVLANSMRAESGLLAVTVMGVALGAQRFVAVRRILEFKENLRVLLISTLFILLAARLDLAALSGIIPAASGLLVVLIVIVRPVSVALSTIGSPLGWNERAMLMLLAPRGIVAAAVVTVFALRLETAGYEQAQTLVPMIFFVIAGSIVAYSLPARFLAKALDVGGDAPEGVLLMGAHPWAREIGKALQKLDFKVLLVDSNYLSVRAARMDGLPAHYANLVSEEVIDELDLDGIGRMLALTPNYAANCLAAVHVAELFGVREVYQLAPEEGAVTQAELSLPLHLRGRFLFDEGQSYSALTERFRSGATVKATTLGEEFGMAEFREMYGESALPLFVASDNGSLEVVATDNPPEPKAGQTLISLVGPNPD